MLAPQRFSCAIRRLYALRSLLITIGFLCPGYAASAVVAPLTRFPNASDTSITFVAHGDLWIVPLQGGHARRLVQSEGHISAPHFSPDGRLIAYTDRHSGGQDVYVVAASGGAPVQLTFDARTKPESNLVAGWTPDGTRVVFLSDRTAWTYKVLQAFTVPVGGGAPERLPIEQTGLLSFGPGGQEIALSRTFTNFAARKRYIGGNAQDIFTYDLSSHGLKRITDWKGTDTFPMWSGRRIYFLSDRDSSFRANIWCYDLDSKETRQVTHFQNFDIDWPSLGAHQITFQQGGSLWMIDLPSENLHKVSVEVPEDGIRTAERDMVVDREVRSSDVTGAVDYQISPRGKTAVFSAHGDIFTVELADGKASDITSTPGVDEEHPAWSRDGQFVAYITEADGAQQVAIRPRVGGAEQMLTKFQTGVFYTPVWSPDGSGLIIPSAEHELWWVRTSGGTPQLIARDPVAEIRDVTFSPDSRWIAYSTQRNVGTNAIHLHELASGRDAEISSTMESDRLPAFSSDGQALYFVSQRHELPIISDRGDDAIVSSLKSDGIYSVLLSKSHNGPLEEEPAFDGIMSRVVPLAVPPSRIVSLETRGEEVIYETRPPALISGELPGEIATLHAFNVATGIDRDLVTDLDNYSLSGDGTTTLFRRKGQWHIALNATAGSDAVLKLAGLKAPVRPTVEWKEMFERAWRLDRDLFFSRSMNGSDWTAVHAAYERLVPSLGSRDDLLYLLGELQGELATSHAFIGGLDADQLGSAIGGRLGLDLTLDTVNGHYAVAHVYGGDPARERYRSPLGSSDLKIGDLILAIDGHELTGRDDIDRYLATASSSVELIVASKSDGQRRTIKVRPVRDDLNLRQYDWVESNRRMVDLESHGRLGYVFLADFNELGSEDLIRQLQPQLDKDGLVLDVRWNRGGFTSQAVLNLLKRVKAGEFVNREGALQPLPLFVAPRAMAVLTNQTTASDGDQFAYFFHALGLGPVVGERTWGGVQGIRGPWPLMDGTTLTIPKDSLAGTDGHWLIENEGVDPDVPVTPGMNDILDCRDQQLDAAVQTVLKQLAASPPPTPQGPPALPAYPSGGNVPGAVFLNE